MGFRGEKTRCFFAGVVSLAFGACPGFAFPTQDDNTPGELAADYQKQSNVWSRFDLGLVDAKVTSSPPDKTKLDRRVEGMAIAGFDAQVMPRFGLRLNAKAFYQKGRRSEKEPPRSVVEHTRKRYLSAGDVTYVTSKGLELFAGLVHEHNPAFSQTVESGSVNAETQFKTASIQARRFGVARRSSAWTGGFYYVQGEEEDREFEKEASDGSSLAGNDVLFIPDRVGVFGRFKAGAGQWNFELSFIQARGMGNRDKNGQTIYTDYFLARAGGFFPLTGGMGVAAKVAHQTLSYADNAYVSLETIPVTSVKTRLALGDAVNNAYVGFIGAYGEDGQSLPEFNADYALRAGAVTVGFFQPLSGGGSSGP